jgi:hypothetical protein
LNQVGNLQWITLKSSRPLKRNKSSKNCMLTEHAVAFVNAKILISAHYSSLLLKCRFILKSLRNAAIRHP